MKKTTKKCSAPSHKWIVISVCFLMVFTCLGFCNQTKGLFLDKITKALHIERSLYAFSDSCRFIATAVVNLFFGTLITKLGARKLIAAGFCSLIASMLLYSAATQVWMFYIAGALLGIGLSWTTTTMVGYVVNKWSPENKGTIMGLVLAASGVGGALAIQIVSPIIESPSNPFAYKQAYRLIAIILLAVGIFVVVCFRNKPSHSATTTTQVKKNARNRSWDGIDFQKIIRTPYFYGACICIFLSGLVLQGISGIAKAHMCDVGLNAGYVTLVLTISSLTLSFFKFFTGFFYDKCGLRATVIVCTFGTVLVSFALAAVTNSFLGKLLAMSYSVFASMAFPLETIMLPIYASDLFGNKAFEKTMGIFVSLNTAGYALGAPLMNLCYDVFGSYALALNLSGMVGIGILVLLQYIVSAGKRERMRAEKSITPESKMAEAEKQETLP